MKAPNKDTSGTVDFLIDFHVHSNYSDGVQTIQSNASYATALGIDKIVFADHYAQLNNEKIKYYLPKKKINEYIEECRQNNAIPGLEIDYLGEEDRLLAKTKDIKKVDLVYGSIHVVEKTKLFSETLKVSNPQELIKKYLEYFVKLAEKKEIKAICHPFWVPEKLKLQLKKKLTKDYLEDVAERMAQSEIAIEINTMFPSLTLKQVKIFTGKGVKITVGSDAHSPESMVAIKKVYRQLEKEELTHYLLKI